MPVPPLQVKKQNPGSYQRLRQLCSREARRYYVFANEHHKETYITAQPGGGGSCAGGSIM